VLALSDAEHGESGQSGLMAPSDSGPGTGVDELRRRIYRQDATDEDRARYRALAGDERSTLLRAATATAEPAPSTAPSGRAHGVLLLAGLLALVALGAVTVGLLPHRSVAPPAPPPETIAVDGPTRSDFLQNLAGGGAAGIAAYLVTHPSPPQLRSATRFFTVERNGTGPGSISLNGVPPEADEGRATVFLVLQVEGRGAWTAYRVREQSDDPSPLQVVARRAGIQRAGVPTDATFRYGPGGRPVRLDLDVPEGVRWGAAVVFSD
jgi:hypothetical protein